MAPQTKLPPAAPAHAAPAHVGPAHVGPAHSPWIQPKAPHEAAHAAPARPPWFATVIPWAAVLVLVTGGVYISWHQGSNGGGLGGVVAGTAFLLAAVVRLVLPADLAGFLASRKRATDVITLGIFGAALLLLGLVLPN
jgi:hypothetical protein